MALEASDGTPVQRYSIPPRRSLFAMVGRRALQRMNGSASLLLVRPVVVMAARALGPGPTRLRLVKLAHNLGGHEVAVEPAAELAFEDHGSAAQPTQRAA